MNVFPFSVCPHRSFLLFHSLYRGTRRFIYRVVGIRKMKKKTGRNIFSQKGVRSSATRSAKLRVLGSRGRDVWRDGRKGSAKRAPHTQLAGKKLLVAFNLYRFRNREGESRRDARADEKLRRLPNVSLEVSEPRFRLGWPLAENLRSLPFPSPFIYFFFSFLPRARHVVKFNRKLLPRKRATAIKMGRPLPRWC